MADESTQVTPVPGDGTPPPAPVDWEKRYNDAAAKHRILEKETSVLKAKVQGLEAGAQTSAENAAALLRTKLAYEKGLPARLFPLISGNTEQEIKAQVDLLLTEFAHSETPVPASVEPIPAGGTPPGPAPAPRPAPALQGGESWLDKYKAADLETRAKMDREVQESGVSRLQ